VLSALAEEQMQKRRLASETPSKTTKDERKPKNTKEKNPK